LDLALVLIKQNQHTPAKFDRDLQTFVSDAMYDWANAMLKADQSASPYLDVWVAAVDGEKTELQNEFNGVVWAAAVDSEQMSLAPPVQSKLYAMLAKHKNRVGEYQTVIALCEKAEQVNPEGHGTKGLKAAAVAKLKETLKDE
jgi:hypothetical protein